MTSKQIIEKIGITSGKWNVNTEGCIYDSGGGWVADVHGSENLVDSRLIAATPVMLYALIEIGLDWESEIMTYPEDHRQLHERADDLEWLSGILKQATGMTWGDLTDDN